MPTTDGSDGALREPRLRPAPRRRNLGAIVGGALLAAVSLAGFWAWQDGLERPVPVLVTTRALPAGHELGAGDVETVHLDASGPVAALSASDDLAGQRLLVDLPVGAPVAPGDVLPRLPVDEGEAVLSVTVSSGELPYPHTPGHLVGEEALVVDTGSVDALGGPPELDPASGDEAPPRPHLRSWLVEVVAVDVLEDSEASLVEGVRVTVRTTVDAAVEIARAAAHEGGVAIAQVDAPR